MSKKLLNETTEKLLEKFGAGDHKPGSGSAAAFQGMISAKLLVTVISLTNEEKRRENYSEWLPTLLKMDADIQGRIFPELTKLFQEDAIQFDKTIKSREERDKEKNLAAKNRLTRQALIELKISTEIPVKIAKLSIELAEMAQFVFDKGFQSARGDSQVALSGAVAALAGCMSIVQLNLLSFGSDEYNWTEKIITETVQLKTSYQKFNSIANSKIETLETEVKEKALLYKEVNEIISRIKSKQNPTDTQIETCAIQFQNLIWRYREKIWKKNVPEDPIEILNPSMVFKKLLGYEFYKSTELGKNESRNGISEIAGSIDQSNKLVLISNQFPEQTQNFTAAHELGHAVLHKQSVMHRDKPLDRAETKSRRIPEELQADKFASFFLMPKKQITEIFQECFLTEKFIIDENSVFNLTQGRTSALRDECKDLRGLSRKLAKAESFAGQSFKSISELFNVSVEAIAIRLEELDLVKFK
ncbi:hypothetical protein BH10BAC1_BH10BAC1_12260 [soil metagenome]